MPSDIDKLMEFWDSGDEALAHELFHPDVVVRAVLQEVRGPTAYAAFVRSFNEGFDGLKPELKEFFYDADGGKQTILWRAEGVHTREFRGIKPTGEHIVLGEYHIQHVTDGLITQSWTGPWGSLDLWNLIARHGGKGDAGRMG